jgi:hypothetical protein
MILLRKCKFMICIPLHYFRIMSRSVVVGYVNGWLCKLAIFSKKIPMRRGPLEPPPLRGRYPPGPPQLRNLFYIACLTLFCRMIIKKYNSIVLCKNYNAWMICVCKRPKVSINYFFILVTCMSHMYVSFLWLYVIFMYY